MQKQEKNIKTVYENVSGKPLTYRKRVGSTVYVVTVNFSKTSKETAEDKLLRMIKREAENIE